MPATTIETSAELGPVSSAAGRLVLGVQDSGKPGPSSWVAMQAGSWPDPVLVVHAWTEAVPGLPEAATVDWLDVDVWPAAVEEPGLTVAAALRDRGVSVDVQICCNSAADALLSLLGPADEVVVGSRAGHAWRRAFGANVVHCLLERAPCPVVVVPDDWQPTGAGPPRIVVAYDGTPASDAALTWAIGHCRRIGGNLDLVRVVFTAKADVRRDTALREVNDRAARLMGSRPFTGVRLVELGPESQGTPGALARESLGAHALVIGSHATTWLSEVLDYGTVERTSSLAACPIVVVPVPA